MTRRSMILMMCVAAGALTSIDAAQVHADQRDIAGAWNVTIEFDSMVLCTAPTLFTVDGGMIANACDNRESPGYGQWVRTGKREFASTFVGFEYALDGSTTGTYQVRARATLSDDGTEFVGPFVTDVFDLDGNVVFSAPGTVRATRINIKTF